MDYILNRKCKKTCHVHSGRNYLSITVLILLILVMITSIYSISLFPILMSLLIIACLFGLICIRFSRIYLYDERFELVRVSLISWFTERNIFKYNDLSSVEFLDGFTDWTYFFVLAIFGSSGFAGNSKADQLIIKTLDGKIFCFNRFGDKMGFRNTIELIQKQIKDQVPNLQ